MAAQITLERGDITERHVGFPAVSAGVYGWLLHDAARITLATVQNTPTRVREARFVLFSTAVLDAFRAVHQSTTPG
ncbi:MAG: hypothetical protein ACRDQ4_14870 [Pseudonocardiaceae bacterium]